MIPTEPGLTEGQRRDPVSGIVQPWYTHAALDEIQSWDLAGKTVLEWGGGGSTLWWASRARAVFTVEDNPTWIAEILRGGPLANVTIVATSALDAARYVAIPPGCTPDIVAIDGALRTECLGAALALPRPLRIIVDNWQQDRVYIDPVAVALMAPFAGRFYDQPDHTDHDGVQGWQTAIWDLP